MTETAVREMRRKKRQRKDDSNHGQPHPDDRDNKGEQYVLIKNCQDYYGGYPSNLRNTHVNEIGIIPPVVICFFLKLRRP